MHRPEAQALVSLQLLPVFVPGDPGRRHGSEGHWNVQLLRLYHHQVQCLEVQCWVTWNRKHRKLGQSVPGSRVQGQHTGLADRGLTVGFFGKDVLGDVRGIADAHGIDGSHSQDVLLLRDDAFLHTVLEFLHRTRVDPHPLLCSGKAHLHMVASDRAAAIPLWGLPDDRQEIAAGTGHVQVHRWRRNACGRARRPEWDFIFDVWIWFEIF